MKQFGWINQHIEQKSVVNVELFFTIYLFLVVISFDMNFFFLAYKKLTPQNCKNIVAIYCDNILIAKMETKK